MTYDLAASDRPVVILTVPHPATRRAADFLRQVFAAGDRRVAFTLVTDADRVRETGVPTFYLRPGVTDALDLAVAGEVHRQSASPAACALLAALDERWHGVPRLSLECVMDRPCDAVRFISRELGQIPVETMLAAAEAKVTALREDVAPFLHVLPFLAAVDPGEPGVAWMDEGLSALNGVEDVLALVPPGIPRRMLVVTRPEIAPAVDLGALAPGWRLDPCELGGAARCGSAAEGGFGLVYLDRVHGCVLGELLDRVMDRLVPGGLLCGKEHTDMAVEAAVAQLTKAGERHQLVFALSGDMWCAIPPAWWR
jgi:hypothetical protein